MNNYNDDWEIVEEEEWEMVYDDQENEYADNEWYNKIFK